jgi:uncharacterized protein involved in outer membrane biogenesis
VIRRLFKWTFRLLVLVLLAVTVLVLGRNTFLRLLLEQRVQAATGFETTVGRAYLEWARPVLRFEHVRLFNPVSLEGEPFLDILEAKVTYRFTPLFSQRFHVRKLELKIGDVRLVRGAPGHSTQALLSRQRAQGAPRIAPVLVDPFIFTGVDHLFLTVHRYTYHDRVAPHLSQRLALNVRDLSVYQLTARADWERLWAQLAQAQGIVPPPLPPPPVSLPVSLTRPPGE